MRSLQGIPTAVLQDKERLADYILAHAPASLPASSSCREGSVVTINLSRLKAWAVRPTAMTISTAVHVLVLAGLVCWTGIHASRKPSTVYAITFQGSVGESGDGREAGGSGSARIQGPDLAQVERLPEEPP